MTAPYELGETPRIVVGQGTLNRLQAWTAGLERPVLLVGDKGIEATGLLARARDAIGSSLPTEVFVAPPGEPTTTTVNTAGQAARALGRPAIVGIGGGTALDLAKLTAAMAMTDQPIEAFLLGADTFPDRAPAAMVPTTSGTGAEVTRTCIVGDTQGRKLWVWDDKLIPDLVILDPELTISLPAHLTVATGLDAFVHALEANTGGRRTRMSDAYALQAMRLIQDTLEATIARPSDLQARQIMQEAATLAGLAIETGGTGMAHNIGHALGSLYRVPHGVAVAVGLQASLGWSIEGASAAYAATTHALGIPDAPSALATRFDSWLEILDLKAAIRRSDLRRVEAGPLVRAMGAPENAPMATNNARVPEPEDLELLAERTAALWNAALVDAVEG